MALFIRYKQTKLQTQQKPIINIQTLENYSQLFITKPRSDELYLDYKPLIKVIISYGKRNPNCMSHQEFINFRRNTVDLRQTVDKIDIVNSTLALYSGL